MLNCQTFSFLITVVSGQLSCSLTNSTGRLTLLYCQIFYHVYFTGHVISSTEKQIFKRMQHDCWHCFDVCYSSCASNDGEHYACLSWTNKLICFASLIASNISCLRVERVLRSSSQAG